MRFFKCKECEETFSKDNLFIAHVQAHNLKNHLEKIKYSVPTTSMDGTTFLPLSDESPAIPCTPLLPHQETHAHTHQTRLSTIVRDSAPGEIPTVSTVGQATALATLLSLSKGEKHE